MSLGLHAYALKLHVGNPTAKLILVGLAEHAHDDGTAAFPSRAKLATYGECSIRSVQRHLKYLRRLGFISTGDQRYVAHIRPDKRPVVYDIAISSDMRKAWAGAAASEESLASPRNGRGDKLSPRDGATSSQVQRRDNLSPRERGDTGVASGVTQLCPTNPPLNPPPPPTPSTPSSGFEPEAAEAEESINEAADFVASLPGGLTQRQTTRLATQVSKRLAAGWPSSALRKELTTDTDNVRSLFAVYEHRLRGLADSPPSPRPERSIAQAPVEGQHAFVVAEDDDWCAQCHRPASNAVHGLQGAEATAPNASEPALPVRRSDAALAA